MRYLVLFLLLPGCAFGHATGKLCRGAEADIWGFGPLQKPELNIQCQGGGGLTFNNENEMGKLVDLVNAIASLKGGIPLPLVANRQSIAENNDLEATLDRLERRIEALERQ